MKIKVISLNMWLGGCLFPNILDFLKTEAADIVLLQEVYNGTDPALEDRYRSMQVLRSKLDYAYTDYAQAFIHDCPAGKIPQGNAILSKLPITSRSFRFLAEPTLESYQDIAEHWPLLPRILQHVSLQTEGKEVDIFNMHGVWDMDGGHYSKDRQEMGRIIIQETSGKQRVVLGGDSNANTENKLIHKLDNHLENVFGTELSTTFNMRHKDNPGYATAAVDNIYVSRGITVLERECPDVDVSDHLPLVATLQLP